MILRIKKIQLKKKNIIERIAQRISEFGQFEVSFVCCISDGIVNGQLNIEIDTIPMKIASTHEFQTNGFTLYRPPLSPDGVPITPNFLDVHICVMESDEGTREKWAVLDKAFQTEAYSNLMATVAEMAAAPWAGVVSIAKPLFKIITGVMSGNRDDLWLQNSGSFERKLGEYSGDFVIENDRLKMFFSFMDSGDA